VEIREARPEDAGDCGRVVYEAFKGIAERRGFPPDFPAVEAATEFMTAWTAHPAIYGVVAELDGSVEACNFLDQRDPIYGVGPMTVAPAAQGQGIGRKLMKDVLEHGGDGAGIRLLQAPHNPVSMSLYASLGFEVKEPVVRITGVMRSAPADGVEVRAFQPEGDVEACEQLCRRVHGFERSNELRDAAQVPMLTPTVAVRDGRITAYATGVHFWPLGHGVAETDEDLQAVILGAAATSDAPVDLLLPVRQASLFRWALGEGLRVVNPMTLMTMGEYREPQGAWFPSVLY
jgi:GNAT superfamily N-acetyltransferase